MAREYDPDKMLVHMGLNEEGVDEEFGDDNFFMEGFSLKGFAYDFPIKELKCSGFGVGEEDLFLPCVDDGTLVDMF